ncbi:2-heptaprenyl-1 4-naphthoquinone methyltransferase [Ophiostoma piceae UAMH 11346]|uniref:2-heptaprenyl-1 4-naphthoquinone methyltransferase n=1 Tax=Ophiostoma piceae (strain UAMH 11346) TaxID=1262450 RepID=S3C6U2_OPHP1|nr:2-heptaprenyl-1 4-naphthoquinone methyltransferase [Ophiostoma piceae UAMH 11346]
MSHLAKVADRGFHDASAYDAHRPSYRPEVVSAFLGQLGVLEHTGAAPLKIVEIGAGTGKFTQVLSGKAAEDKVSLDVIAVEPHDQMRAQLIAKNLPHITVVKGHGADLGIVQDATVDAVVIAQAFHWFANAEALAEIRRVLKPGAFVGVIWNIEDYNKPREWTADSPFDQALNDIILSLTHDGSPRFRDSKWQQAFVDAARAGLYAPLDDDRVQWTVTLSPDALWKRLLTLSQIANLPETGPSDDKEAADTSLQPTSRATVHRRVEAATARDDAPRDAQGNVTIHAVTYFAWAQKR